MLLALVLGGLAVAVATPLMLSSDEDEEEAFDTPEGEAETPEAAPAPAGSFEDDAPGDLYEVPADAGTFVLDGFSPEADTCLIRMADADALISTAWAEDGTPLLRAEVPGGTMTVVFEGMTSHPVDAVHFVTPDEASGEDCMLSLAEILERGALDAGADPPPDAARTVILDGGGFPEWTLGEPLDDLGPLSPVPVTPDGLTEDVDGLLDALVPLAPAAGDAVDTATDAIDDLSPASPTDGAAADAVPAPLTGVAPVAPNPGEEVPT